MRLRAAFRWQAGCPERRIGRRRAAEIGKASGAFKYLPLSQQSVRDRHYSCVFAQTGGIHSPQAFNTGLTRKLGVFAALSHMAEIAGMWRPTPRETAFAVGVKP